MTQEAHLSAELIKKRLPKDFTPLITIVLGSGLGDLANEITNPIIFNYDELPGFPPCSIEGHSGQLFFGYWNNLPIACMKGRVHYYEGIDNSVPQTMMRTMRLLGTETLLATNAAGSLRADILPGECVAIHDHINFQFTNPLTGPNDSSFGPRFIGLETLYHPQLRLQLKSAAQAININLEEGVYIGVLGPTFETPAEIRAFRTLGADVVGMSTIPEVLTAHHCGINVAAVSVITNLGAGMSDTQLSHDITLNGAAKGSANLTRLVHHFLNHYQSPTE